MKILSGIPSILNPTLRMDSVLNMHVTIPLLPADDFIMYGKSIIMEEAGVLNDNICTNMLFALESVYSEEMNAHGFHDFWLPSAREQFLDISALVGCEIWDPRGIFDPLSSLNFPVHMSDIIWRRDFSDNGEGKRVYYGVYPDNNTIPMHNFMTGRAVDHDCGDSWKTAGNKGYQIYYYYEPLPSLGIKGNPDDTTYYGDFRNRCDPEIYKWIKTLMSALMIYSADSIAAVRDMACISDLENKPDESAFPDGDVFTSGDRTPIKKLCASLRTLPQTALIPHKKIWTAAQFEKYLPNEVQKVLKEAVLSETEIRKTDDRSINRIALDSMAAGRLAGLDGGKYRDGVSEDINRDEEQDIAEKSYCEAEVLYLSSDETEKNTKPPQNVSKQLFPRFTPTPEQIAEKELGLGDLDIDPYQALLLDSAFVDNKEEDPEIKDTADKNEDFFEKAFMEFKEAPGRKSLENSPGPQDKRTNRQADDPMNLKSEAEKTGHISKMLDSAFLEDSIG